MDQTMDRRSLIKAAGLVAVGTAFVSAVETRQASASIVSNDFIAGLPYGIQQFDVQETQEFDLIIVGSGISGMSAAMEAADSGADVVLIEKADMIGGVSFGTEGMFGLGSQMQKDAGVEMPTVAEAITEELVYTNYRADANLWRDLLTNSGDDIDWLQEHGVLFDRPDSYNGASSFKCFHWWPGGNGSAMGGLVEDYLKTKDNVTVMLGTEVVDLIDEDGSIVGVYAKLPDGNIIAVKAPATIMATGGFSENKERVTQCTGVDMSNGITFGTGSTGEGHDMMLAHDAKMSDTCLLLNVALNGISTQALSDIMLVSCYQCLPSVNQDGERYMAEDVFAHKFTALQVNAMQTQKYTYTIIDQGAIERFETKGLDCGFVTRKIGDLTPDLRTELEEAVTNPDVKAWKADTIDSLAEQLGMNPKMLQTTIDRYNEFSSKGQDDDFGCEPTFLRGIGDGPYYAVHCDIFLNTTIGGIACDRKGQAINNDDEVIPGLFCSGVEGCGLYRETYNFQMSGGMCAFACYSGRNAARNALGIIA